jgi:hypothetical protein
MGYSIYTISSALRKGKYIFSAGEFFQIVNKANRTSQSQIARKKEARMNQEKAKQRINDGITYEELRDLLRTEFDGQDSVVIHDFTKLETHHLVSGCIDKKYGTVNSKSHDALVAQIALREFAPDNN